MDYPKSTPGIGLVNGKFADENPSTGQIGSLIPSGWGNSVTDEILAVIRAANLVPDEADRAQLSKAIAALIAAPSGAVAGTYTQVRINARGVVVEGKNPTTLAGYGITDAYTRTQADQLLSAKAPLVSPAFSGIPTADTASLGTSTDQLANTRFVSNTRNALMGTVPATLDTLAKLAAAVNNDAAFAATMIAQLATKAAKATTLAGYGITDAAAKADLTAKADKATTLGGYGIADAYTRSQIDTALSDPWAFQPIGVPIPVFDGASSGLAPARDKAYRYIRLTAADSYNSGFLTNEVVSGSAPLLDAYATINAPGSLLHNALVRLINTERRFIRAGSVGAIENDQLQGFTLPAATANGSGGAAFDVWAGASVNTTKTPIVTDGVNGTPRIGTETRPRNVGANYYMRIL